MRRKWRWHYQTQVPVPLTPHTRSLEPSNYILSKGKQNWNIRYVSEKAMFNHETSGGYFLVISISQGGVSEFLPRWGKSYFQFMTSEKSKIKCSSFICLTII